MVAPQGAGKGTQADRLAAHYGIEHISSGDLLRTEVAKGTEVGRAAKEYLDQGDLVPDDVILQMMVRRLMAAAARGFVLDGWPRTIHQALASRPPSTSTSRPTSCAVGSWTGPAARVAATTPTRPSSTG
jgi:adenylate kinase